MKPIVVLGASGKTGRRIVDRLRARGLPVRPGSRSAQPPFDWNEPQTWTPALAGASAAYVSYFPDLAAPGAAEAVGALAGVAIEAGVDRLVLLSGRGEEEAERSEGGRDGAAAVPVHRGARRPQRPPHRRRAPRPRPAAARLLGVRAPGGGERRLGRALSY